MEKIYLGFDELVDKHGLMEALSYKLLEFRDRYPFLNRLCSELMILHSNSSAYEPSYVAAWDKEGKLAYFNPNPHYPADFVRIDFETHKPVRKSAKEIKRSARESGLEEFASTVAEILG